MNELDIIGCGRIRRQKESPMKRSLMRWAAVGAMVLVCSLSGEVSAEPQRSQWYIGGGIGANWVHDIEEKGWNRDTYCSPRICDEPGLSENIEGISIPGYRWNYDLDLDLGSAFEISLGRTFNRWRLEISAAQRKNDIDQTFTGSTYLDGRAPYQPPARNKVVSNSVSRIDDLTTRTLSLNVYYDFLDVFHPKVTPYLGVGLGVAFGEMSDVHYSTNYEDLADPSRDLSFYNSHKDADMWDTVVVGNFYIGTDYHLTDKILAGVKLTYSIMDDLEAKAGYRDHPVHRENPDFRSNEHFSSPHQYSVMFTMKYMFGG